MLHYDSDTDSDYQSEDDETDIEYDSEEISLTRFNIALCELYNTNIHGPETSEVLTHYLVISRYKEFNIEYISNIAEYINNKYVYFGANGPCRFNDDENLFTDEFSLVLPLNK
jgi:hypothetical protein